MDFHTIKPEIIRAIGQKLQEYVSKKASKHRAYYDVVAETMYILGPIGERSDELMKKLGRKQIFQDVPIIISQYGRITAATTKCDACSPVIFATTDRVLSTMGNPCYMESPVLVKQSIDTRYTVVLSPYQQFFSVLNTSAIKCLQYFHTPKLLESLAKARNLRKVLIDSTLSQMVSSGLLVPEEWQTQAYTPTEIPDILSVWLHLTDCCNLRCDYCYLQHQNIDMTLEIGKKAVEAIFRSAISGDYREVKFKYAGGEPLLQFSLIKELHLYAKKLAEQYELKVDGVVLSNGTLLAKKMVKEMQALGLRLMVSLDHLPAPYPSQVGIQRVYPEGRDASSDAMRGIELVLECGLVPDISITVSGRNVSQLPELLTWVLERKLPFILNFYRPHECTYPPTPLRMTGDNDLQLEEETFIEGMLRSYKVIESNLPQQSLLASLADLANFAAPHLRRCSVGHSYLVFDCDGNVSKCQMQMDRPVTNMLVKDPLAEIRTDICGIQNITVDEKEGCLDCQWRYWCAGGCPLESYRMTGRYDVKSPHCGIYKALYPEIVRLEGLRLLKQSLQEIKH